MGNQIGAAGAVALAEALKTNQTLTWVDLFSNEIGNAGATALAEALKTNPGLSSINLGHNGIGNAGAAALAEALKTNQTLTSISLGGNQIDAAGAAALAEALKTNMTLTCMDFSEGVIGAEINDRVEKLTLFNKLVQKILVEAKQFAMKKQRPKNQANLSVITNRVINSSNLSISTTAASSSGSATAACNIEVICASSGANANPYSISHASATSKDTKTQNEERDAKIYAEDKARYDRLNLLFKSHMQELDCLSINADQAAKINLVKALVTLAFVALPDLNYFEKGKEEEKEKGKTIEMSLDDRIALLKKLDILKIDTNLKMETELKAKIKIKEKVLGTLAHLYWQNKDDLSAIIFARHAGEHGPSKTDGLASLLRYIDLDLQESEFESALNAAYGLKELKEKMEALDRAHLKQIQEFKLENLSSLRYKENACKFLDHKKQAEDRQVATQGHANAQFNLDLSNKNGLGSKSKDEKSAEEFKNSAIGLKLNKKREFINQNQAEILKNYQYTSKPAQI